MIEGLSGRVLERRIDGEDLHAVVLLREQDGMEYIFECVCKPDGGIVISGDGETMDLLEQRYTPPGFSGALLELATGLPR